MDAIVVGAGPAGLGAAWRLQRAGVRVQVLEATDWVGGRARTVEWAGFRLDPGAASVSDGDRLLMQCVDELGLRSDLQPYESPLAAAALVHAGGLAPFNPAPPAGLAWRTKLGGGLIPRRARRGEPESLPGGHDRSAGAYLARLSGGRVLADWAGPLLAWRWGYAPDDLSMGVFLHLAQPDPRLWTFRGGIGHLMRTLAAQVHVANGVRVTRIAAWERRACVEFVLDGRQETREADAVVIAVPGTLVGGLLEEMPAAWAPLLGQVAYSVGLAAFLVLEVPEELQLAQLCRLLPAGATGALVGLAVVARSTDRRRLLVQAVPREAAQIFACREDDIYSLVESEMAGIWPELAAGRVQARWLFRWPNQAPCWRPDYIKALRSARPHLRRGPLFLTGDYVAGPGIGAAFADGWACAEQVLGQAT